MRGYSQSTKPVVRLDHAQQSKRTVALDMVQLMECLGFGDYAFVGHDRGCYLGITSGAGPSRSSQQARRHGRIPISEALDLCDANFSRRWYCWFFYAQPDRPERAILADPRVWYGGDPTIMGDGNYAEFQAAIADPATVTAMLEDYRAGLGMDRQHEEEDRCAGRAVGCPTLFLWSARDDLQELYDDPVAIWRDWTDDLESGPIDSGHHMAEKNPATVSTAIRSFLTAPTIT